MGGMTPSRTQNFLLHCGICTHPLVRSIEEPATTDGHRGLDLRMTRSQGQAILWPVAVHRCPNCHACGAWLDHLKSDLAEFVASPAYLAVAQDDLPAGYRDHLAASLLAAEANDLVGAADFALAASWAADADGLPENRRDDAGQRARRRFVNLWFEWCGDVLAGGLPRTPETAAATVTGEVLLDNQVLVDLARRLSDWDLADAALTMARDALAGAKQEAGPFDIDDEDSLQILTGMEMLLELEGVLIRDRDSRFTPAEVELPLWFTE